MMSILAFNWVGYRFISGLLESKADIALESRIEKADYDESNLIEIRVSLNTPYLYGTSSGFERYDGELEVKGIHYKYVKRKIEKGELVLLCLPNEDKTKLNNARMDFFKSVNDLNQTTQSKEKNQTSSFKSSVAEYTQENNSWAIKALPDLLQRYNFKDSVKGLAGFNDIPEQPPQS